MTEEQNEINYNDYVIRNKLSKLRFNRGARRGDITIISYKRWDKVT